MVVRSPGSRPSQIAWIVRRSIFPDRVFGNCETNQTCAGRPKLPIWLSTSAIIAFSCECATSRSSRLSLSFGMTNATATCLSAHLSPQPPPLRQRPDGWRYSLQSRACQTMPGNVNYIVSAPENKVITVSVTDAPVKGGVHRAGKQRPVSLHKAVVVAPDGLNTARRQRPFHTSIPFSLTPHGSPVTSLSNCTL